jgi:hypothetical protein
LRSPFFYFPHGSLSSTPTLPLVYSWSRPVRHSLACTSLPCEMLSERLSCAADPLMCRALISRLTVCFTFSWEDCLFANHPFDWLCEL